MKLRSVHAAALSIPFRMSFRHAAASRAATQSVWVIAESEAGARGHGEGCPREYVTAESLPGAIAFVERVSTQVVDEIGDLPSLAEWVEQCRADIDANPAAWTAVELALLELLALEQGKPVEMLLGLPRLGGRFRYTAVLGDADGREFSAQLGRYVEAGFQEFKIKLSGDLGRDASKVRALRAAGIAPAWVRADANNLWGSADDAIGHVEALGFPFFALEEPVRAADYAALGRIADALGCAIVLDESVARLEQLACLEPPFGRWIVNLRVSKMGGVLRSLQVAAEALRRRLRIIVGAHVGETSLLSRASLVVARASARGLVAQEGAFGTYLLERDVADPPLMFGAGGVLDAGAAAAPHGPGWGLCIREPG